MSGNKEFNPNWMFEIVKEVENDDGSWTLTFDLDEEFIEWFKEDQGLKRWSQKRFQKVMFEAIKLGLERDKEDKNSHGNVIEL